MAQAPDVFAERHYWRQLGQILGWRLRGWDGTYRASFEIPGVPIPVDVYGVQRDSILAAIAAAKQQPSELKETHSHDKCSTASNYPVG